MGNEILSKKVLITPDYYLGLQEWYIPVFECPKCNTKNPIGANFCMGCGIQVKLSKTVSDYNNSEPEIKKTVYSQHIIVVENK